MKKFESFCKNIHKTKEGYVPDLLDLESDSLRDIAMCSWIGDSFGHLKAIEYSIAQREKKNSIYAKYEAECQDAIDQYNNIIDDDRAKKLEIIDDHTMISLCDPDYKWQRFNQEMFDAGHKESDFV